jgi:hypothetical protein
MVEIFALGIYGVQWLGVVLGVGAEVVLLVAHLMTRHQHKPQWLESVPAVRASQFVGLLLIVTSGVAAIAYQFLIGDTVPLFTPVFGFKWVLIGLLIGAYLLEQRLSHGRAMLEGFAGATWFALFLVHVVAPLLVWVDLFFFYTVWIFIFSIVWGVFVLLMKYTGKGSIEAPEPIPVSQKVSPPPAPRPIPKPAPVPVAAYTPPPPKPTQPPPAPISIPKSVPMPPPRAPAPQPAPAPVVASVPTNLPAIEPLELAAPHVAVPPAPKVNYKPDWDHIPGLRIMPQRPEDVHLQNRGPVVQPA